LTEYSYMSNKNDQKTLDLLPPLIFPSRTKSEEARLTKLKKQKKIRKIGPRLYTSLPKSESEAYVRSQWASIVSHLYPHALLSFRSALEYKPTPHHEIILTGTTNRTVKYSGLTLRFVRGPSALEDDPTVFEVRTSSLARAFLENFSTSKSSAWRSLSKIELEKRLEAILQAKGERELNNLREQARAISKKLGWQSEFQLLDQMIGSLLGTQPIHLLQAPTAIARARGRPYDSSRIARFDLLAAAILSTPLKEHEDQFQSAEHFQNKAFFDAYFSNYIEGTTFEIAEAEEIIFDHHVPSDRPMDAHDILGTYEIVSDPNELKKVPKDFSELELFIKKRHQIILSNRAEAHPGEYKTKSNRAGNTHFVHPNEITGTLEIGFQRYCDLPEGLSRAIFILFLISEVHPFQDGNGRIARIMMNAELFSKGLSTIIIPTVYREDYLSALRALTRRDRPDPLIRMLAKAHHFSYLEFSPYKLILKKLENKNWFHDPHDAKLID